MPFFVACVSLWAITVGPTLPPTDGVAEGQLIGGYEIHQLLGPFDLPTETEAVTCDRVQYGQVGGRVLEETPERIVLEAANEDEAMQQLQQLALRRHEELRQELP